MIRITRQCVVTGSAPHPLMGLSSRVWPISGQVNGARSYCAGSGDRIAVQQVSQIGPLPSPHTGQCTSGMFLIPFLFRVLEDQVDLAPGTAMFVVDLDGVRVLLAQRRMGRLGQQPEG